jgi:hypothetical protein
MWATGRPSPEQWLEGEPPNHWEDQTVVFLGPSLPLQVARSILPAVYLPPVAMGDLYGLVTLGPRRILILDGLFHGVPAIWHREILTVLEAGIEVHGAASMGALRAADLHGLGMRGHGQIFRWYRDGQIDADDEVAVLHEPDPPYRSHTIALVNVRDGLHHAKSLSVVNAEEKEALFMSARSIHYEDRDLRLWMETAHRAGVEETTLQRFVAYWRRTGPDLKGSDAREALAALAATATQPDLPQSRVPENVASAVWPRLMPLHPYASHAWLKRRAWVQGEGFLPLELIAKRVPATTLESAAQVACVLWWMGLALQGCQTPKDSAPPATWLHRYRDAFAAWCGIGELGPWCRRVALLPKEWEEEVDRRAALEWWMLHNAEGAQMREGEPDAAWRAPTLVGESGIAIDAEPIPAPALKQGVEECRTLLETTRELLVHRAGVSLGLCSADQNADDSREFLEQARTQGPVLAGFHSWNPRVEALRHLQVCNRLAWHDAAPE